MHGCVGGVRGHDQHPVRPQHLLQFGAEGLPLAGHLRRVRRGESARQQLQQGKPQAWDGVLQWAWEPGDKGGGR